MKIQLADIAGVINEVIQLQKKQLTLENIELKKEYKKHSKVLFDRGQIEQVFLDLFVNARHAMKLKGKGTISISIQDIKNKVQIKFSDTGVGMDEQTKMKIFEPFFTTKGGFSKNGLDLKGIGLGLTVTYTVILQHKGSIEVVSEKGKGTTFIIYLPIVEAYLHKLEKAEEKIVMPDRSKIKDLKVLIIDDEPAVINLMRFILRKAGHDEVVIKKKGSQALEILKTFKPDVIFLDILMPDMNGEQVLKEIKSMRLKVPVVVVSGQTDLKKNELIEKGAYDLIKKPFDIKDIFDILDRITKMK